MFLASRFRHTRQALRHRARQLAEIDIAGDPQTRKAQSDRLQTSLNLALGSALATIGLTIPAVAGVSIALGYRLEHRPKEMPVMIRRASLFALLGVLAVGLQGCGEKKKEASEQPVRGLRAYKVAATAESRVRRFPSVLQITVTARASPRTSAASPSRSVAS